MQFLPLPLYPREKCLRGLQTPSGSPLSDTPGTMSRVRAREEEVSTPKKARTGAEQDARSNAEKHSQAYVRPADWPVAGGEIDLAVQDLPHESANTGPSHCMLPPLSCW